MQLSDEQVQYIARSLRHQGLPVSKNSLVARSEIAYLLKNNRISESLLLSKEKAKLKQYIS
jgi:hypothetical protein